MIDMAQGLYLAIVLIVSFMIVTLAGMYMLANGLTDMDTMKEYFAGLATLAGIFGIGPIITAYVITRGQTSGQVA